MSEDQEFYNAGGSGRKFVGLLSVTDEETGKTRQVFTEKVDEGTPGAKFRKNKNGDPVWEKHHTGMLLTIVAVWIDKKTKFGEQLCIASKNKVIQVPMNSNHARKFIAVCRNIDLSEPVAFEPYRMVKKDKNDRVVTDDEGNKRYTIGWVIKQGGTSKDCKLEEALDMSKDGPVPQWRKLPNGKYDTSEHDLYLESYLRSWIEKKGLEKKGTSETSEEEEEEGEGYSDNGEEEDDTPPPPPKKVTGKVISSKKTSNNPPPF